MSLSRQVIQCFVILLVLTLANTQSDSQDTQDVEETTVLNFEETSEVSTEVVPSELTGDMKRDQRSFFGDLWGDVFDDCDCNDCNCNQGPLPNNFPNALPNNLPNDYNNNYYDDRRRGGFDRRRGDFDRIPVFKPWKGFKKALKKPWFGLFDGDDGCRGGCNHNNNQYHIHQGYDQNNGYNNHNGYNNNEYNNNHHDGNNYHSEPKYEEPKYEEPKYEEPKYEEPKYEEPKYEKPKYEEPAPVYEEPVPAYEEPKYEKPSSVYKKPIYESAEKSYDCGSSPCPPQPQLVYQPIIYFGAPQAHISEGSSEEQEESNKEVENKNCEEENNYEETTETYEEQKEEEKEDKESCEDEKEDKKKHHSHAVVPVAPVYMPCGYGCGGPMPYSHPPFSYGSPQSLPLHQVINYNGLAPHYYPYSHTPAPPAYYPAPPTFSPPPVRSGCGCGQQNYGPVYNNPASLSHSSTHGSVPISSLPHSYESFSSQSASHSHGGSSNHAQKHSNQHHESHRHEANNHGSHHYIHHTPVLTPYDQPYRSCPELFAAYNEQIAHLTSTNSLYK